MLFECLEPYYSLASMCWFICSMVAQKLCYVAADYDAELRKQAQASCEVAGEGCFTLSNERFKAPEILFQPQLGGM